MRRFVTLLALFHLFSPTLSAQNLTGVWRGYFYDNTRPAERYRYEIQLAEGKTNELNGVSYSYKSTEFYGKSGLQGIHMKNNSVIFKEKNLLEVKISKGNYVCLMTCYLDIRNVSGQEVLEGSYISTKMKELSDCGSGYVYLERVPEPIFKKEEFLVRKDSLKKHSPAPPTVKQPVKPYAKGSPQVAKPSGVKRNAPNQAAGRQENVEPEIRIAPLKQGDPQWSDPPKTIYPVPRVVKERENPLIKTIVTYSPDIKVELFDNGQIDHDTVTVYHNNEPIITKAMLTYKAITIQIHADEDETMHEFIVEANNLGEVPPNTALVRITTGGKRYEFSAVTDMKKNARIVVQYVPKKKDN